MTTIVPPSGPVRAHAFRLQPNDSLKDSLIQTAQLILARIPEDECSSIFLMTAVGSLKDVTLRLANASKRPDDTVSLSTASASSIFIPETDDKGGSTTGSTNDIKQWSDQRFEIVSLVGTFCRDGSCHLHLSMSDAKGNTFGGHLMAGTVFTTVEVVFGSIGSVKFVRELDDDTGYGELVPMQILKDERWYVPNNPTKTLFWIAVGFSLHALINKRR